ncbi:restriction endonuclease subunit S [Enterobacter sichuanensis]
MSKLSNLEKLLDGVEVEWSNLGNLCDIFTGGEAPQKHIKGDTPTSDYQYPIYGNGAEIYGYADSYRIGQDAVTISSIGANTGTIYFRKAFFTPIIRLKVVIPKHSWLLPRYLFHYLSSQTINSKSSSVPNMNASDVKKLSIPIPCPNNPEKSLAIQSEIVRILDKFTALTAELTAELTMRKKQYNYYRDLLLSFEEGEVEWKTLGEIAKIQRGASPRPIAQYMTDADDGIPWIKIGDTSPGSKYINGTAQKVTPDGAKKSRILNPGDFVISNSMSFGRPYILSITGAIHDGWASISDFSERLDSDYLYHYLSSQRVKNYWGSKINSGSVSNLNADIIKTLPLPLPDIQKQKWIATLLDKFDTLTSSISEGIPREIELRQKQYEYYRDLLFSFPKSEAASN